MDDTSTTRKRRPLLWIVGIIVFLTLCCLCSFIWLAWTYGDAVLMELLNAFEITF